MQKTHSLKQRWEEHPKPGLHCCCSEEPQLQPGSSGWALPQGLREKHLQAGLLTYFTANNIDLRESQWGCAFFWVPSYCFHHAKEVFWLQVILLQCFGAWDEGGNIFWLIVTISPNTLISSNMWNEIKCTLHRIFLQAFFLTFCSMIYTKLKLLWKVMAILNNSETEVNPNNTVTILKLHLTCS